MQAQYKTYESYKDSGVPWLGNIPKNWDVTRNLGLFDERKEVNYPEAELLSVTIEQGIIKQSEITAKKDSSNEDKRKYKRVLPDDLAYNKMRMWQGAIGRSDYEGIVSPAYIILEPRNKTYSRFYHYLYRTGIFIKEANRNSYGLCDDMNSLRYEDFKTIYSPVPPEDEVNRIVAFLDQKTAEIDTAIEKKQRLIELLKEQKAILINQAVTKGLNPDAPMKDSGIPWIDKIPANWEVKRLKYCVEMLPGFAFKSTEYSSNPDDIKLLRGVNVNPDKIVWDDVVYWPKHKAEFYKAYYLNAGDLVIGMDRPWISSGIRVAEIQEEDKPVLILQRVARIRARSFVTSSFIRLLITTKPFLDYFEPILTGISVPHISTDQIGNFPTATPPRDVQEEICSHIEHLERKFQNLLNVEAIAIQRLQEFKQTLIAHAVTGKIKV